MSFLAQVSRLSCLDRSPKLKQQIKQAYYRCLDPLNRGSALNLGGVDIRVPARFARPPWTDYEPSGTGRVAKWIESRPDTRLIDAGCSVALYSALVLGRCPEAEAWAIDADPFSLQASRWLTRHVGSERFRVIHGYVGDAPTLAVSARDANTQTETFLSTTRTPAEPELTRYTCLDSQTSNAIPIHRIDRLFADATSTRPWIIKIDVEGAELLVLRGSEGFIRRIRPQLLVSVHPPALRNFGLSTADVHAWLRLIGYQIQIDLEPHEELWWCTPTSR